MKRILQAIMAVSLLSTTAFANEAINAYLQKIVLV